jgi:DNA-binding transcriptional ArsR family regulator
MDSAAQPRIARVAAAIGDPTRARMLTRLLDGCHHTAKELADHAGIAASTASGHLRRLLDEQLVRARSQGRHRYFALADGNVAQALEALLRVADGGAAVPTTRWAAPTMAGLRHARSCYGHLAGTLGVRLCRCFVQRRWVTPTDDRADYPLTGAGAEALAASGLDLAPRLLAPGRRVLYGCLDWSERRDHFAGPLAVALLDAFLAQGWLRRRADSRALDLTPRGRVALVDKLLTC